MKYVKSLVVVVIVIAGARLVGHFVGRSLAEQELKRQGYDTHTAGNCVPISALPVYEYTNGPSVKPDFPEYIADEDGFAARFPAKVKVTNYGGLIKTHYAAEIEGEEAYNIWVNSYPAPLLTDGAIHDLLEDYLQGRLLLFGEDAKVIRKREVRFLGRRALDYEYAVESNGVTAYFKGVYFVLGNLGYGITVACAEETKSVAYAKYAQFIKSFRLTQGRKKRLAEEAQKKCPIYWAVATHDLDKIRNLIDKGEDVNCRSLMGHTPLIFAARQNYIDVAELLLEAGATPDLQDGLKWAALHHAILPLERGCHNEIVALLLRYGADVNIQDARKRTPLHRAAQFGCIKAVRLLLDGGADATAVDKNGWTPADRAAGHQEMVSLLNEYK